MSAILAALVNGAIVSVLVASMVALAMRAAPRRLLNAATRYVIWWAALALTIAMVAWYLPGADGLPAFPVRGAHTDATKPHGTGGSAVDIASGTYPAPSVRTDLNLSSPTGSRRSLFPFKVAPGQWTEWVAGVWLLATVLMLTKLVVSCVLLERRKARAIAAPPLLAERVDEWLKQCGSWRRGARLACSTEIATPLAAGLRGPSILIPSRLLGELSKDELEQIGLHEAAHLARFDDYALILQRVLEALFALHPVLHWITRRINLEREIACDDVVVEATGHARSYAACLTRVVEFAGRSRDLRVAVAAADGRSHLATRVEVLLQRSHQGGPHLRISRLTGALAALAVVAWAAARVPGVVAFAMPMPARQTSLSSLVTKALPLAVFSPPGPAQRPIPVLDAFQQPSPLPQPAPAPPQPQSETNVPGNMRLVQIPVIVTDPNNRFVTGLEKEHFRLFENDVEQEISQVSGEDAPLSVGVVFNARAGMAGDIEQARAAVDKFLEVLNPKDEFFLVQSKDHSLLINGFTNKVEALQRSLSSSDLDEGGALLDGVYMAMNEMKKAHNPRKAILIISDGGNNISRYTESEVKNAVREADVQIYGIGILAPTGSRGRTPEGLAIPGLLSEVAELTGGRSYYMSNLSELSDIAAEIGIELRNQYGLYFTPRNQSRDGEYHRVFVELVQPRGLPVLKAFFRPVYYAPSQ